MLHHQQQFQHIDDDLACNLGTRALSSHTINNKCSTHQQLAPAGEHVGKMHTEPARGNSSQCAGSGSIEASAVSGGQHRCDVSCKHNRSAIACECCNVSWSQIAAE